MQRLKHAINRDDEDAVCDVLAEVDENSEALLAAVHVMIRRGMAAAAHDYLTSHLPSESDVQRVFPAVARQRTRDFNDVAVGLAETAPDPRPYVRGVVRVDNDAVLRRLFRSGTARACAARTLLAVAIASKAYRALQTLTDKLLPEETDAAMASSVVYAACTGDPWCVQQVVKLTGWCSPQRARRGPWARTGPSSATGSLCGTCSTPTNFFPRRRRTATLCLRDADPEVFDGRASSAFLAGHGKCCSP